MRCQADDCYAEVASHTSDYCKMHEAEGTFAFSYHEWDADRWYDRRDLLLKMWLHEEETEQEKKSLIADLIIHANDISEDSRTRSSQQ